MVVPRPVCRISRRLLPGSWRRAAGGWCSPKSFRSYGLLLIIDCGGGYHVVMSGFDRLDVRLGQGIVAAEPVGVMPGWEPGSTARRPALNVELRHDGQPINPAPWFKSSG